MCFVQKILLLPSCLALSVTCAPVTVFALGTFEQPFQADSPWNSRPIKPVLGEYTIPDAKYVPTIASNIYSTGVFYADAKMPPMTVGACAGKRGIYDDDAEEYKEQVTIPHWPADTASSGSGDGNAEIVDVSTGIVHSFYQLIQVGGRWCATLYGWTALGGRGWGDPAHYHQGARASGMSVLGGLIRKHEVHDGAPMYRHALAMSLDISGLSPNPAYVFPASSADTNAATVNYGRIPQGTLMMLPGNFNPDLIKTPRLKKIALTLKEYGAYVVERNYGTPYAIYAEIGSDTYLHSPKWDVVAVADLQLIQKSLKPVVSVDAWLSADGVRFNPDPKKMNILSMRGRWIAYGDAPKGEYNTWQQAVTFPASPLRSRMINYSPNILARTTWSKPLPGRRYRLTSDGSGGGNLRLELLSCVNKAPIVDSGEIAAGQSFDFNWPESYCGSRMTVLGGINRAAVVKGSLILTD